MSDQILNISQRSIDKKIARNVFLKARELKEYKYNKAVFKSFIK